MRYSRCGSCTNLFYYKSLLSPLKLFFSNKLNPHLPQSSCAALRTTEDVLTNLWLLSVFICRENWKQGIHEKSNALGALQKEQWDALMLHFLKACGLWKAAEANWEWGLRLRESSFFCVNHTRKHTHILLYHTHSHKHKTKCCSY